MGKDVGHSYPVGLMAVPGKIMNQSPLPAVAKLMKNRTVKQHSGITRGKFCLNNMIIFYSEMTGLVDERRAVDVIYLNFSIVLGIVSVGPLQTNRKDIDCKEDYKSGEKLYGLLSLKSNDQCYENQVVDGYWYHSGTGSGAYAA